MEQLRADGKGKKILRPTRRRRFTIHPGVGIMLLVFLLLIGICLLFALKRETAEPPAADTDTAEQTEAAEESETSLELLEGFEAITVPTSEMHEGDLILVNYAYAHVLPEDNDICSVFDYKTKSYKVSNTSTQMSKAVTERFNVLMDDFYKNSGCGDVLLVSGYRSVEKQQEIYRDRVETDGAEEAAKYVAVPGYSEHHTGLAMDLSVYLADGTTHYLLDYAPAKWYRDHAHEYGFILRYPSDKAEITRISYESWHYRYVGTPHAQIITEKVMCLEEYTEYVDDFVYGEKYLVRNGGDTTESTTFPKEAEAVIYFVPASTGDTTRLCVPKGWDYTVSGNNVNGFVITAYGK